MQDHARPTSQIGTYTSWTNAKERHKHIDHREACTRTNYIIWINANGFPCWPIPSMYTRPPQAILQHPSTGSALASQGVQSDMRKGCTSLGRQQKMGIWDKCRIDFAGLNGYLARSSISSEPWLDLALFFHHCAPYAFACHVGRPVIRCAITKQKQKESERSLKEFKK